METAPSVIDQDFDRQSVAYVKLLEAHNRLLRACRALARLDRAALQSITPVAMQTVCRARGWVMVNEQCMPGDRSTVAFQVFDNPKAVSGYIIPCVKVPMRPDMVDYPQRVSEWANDLATRHGDVAPAEVLAEALSQVG